MGAKVFIPMRETSSKFRIGSGELPREKVWESEQIIQSKSFDVSLDEMVTYCIKDLSGLSTAIRRVSGRHLNRIPFTNKFQGFESKSSAFMEMLF